MWQHGVSCRDSGAVLRPVLLLTDPSSLHLTLSPRPCPLDSPALLLPSPLRSHDQTPPTPTPTFWAPTLRGLQVSCMSLARASTLVMALSSSSVILMPSSPGRATAMCRGVRDLCYRGYRPGPRPCIHQPLTPQITPRLPFGFPAPM